MLIKKYTEQLRVVGADVHQVNFQQNSILLWIDVDAVDQDPWIAAGNSLNFLNDTFLHCFNLVFKQVFPQCGAIPRTSRQLSLPYIECIQQIAFDQFKISQREFFILPLCVETNECGHANTYACILASNAAILSFKISANSKKDLRLRFLINSQAVVKVLRV